MSTLADCKLIDFIINGASESALVYLWTGGQVPTLPLESNKCQQKVLTKALTKALTKRATKAPTKASTKAPIKAPTKAALWNLPLSLL